MLTKRNVLLAVLALVISGTALAGGDANAFDPIWTEISEWAVNAPGKIIAFLTFGAAVFNVIKQNYYAAVGAFFICMLMAQARDVIEFFLDAGVML